VNGSKARKQKKVSDVTASKGAPAKAAAPGTKAIAAPGTKAIAAPEVGLRQVTVRERAYELYLSRGGEHGQDEDDWFRAEQEILER
jgi:hypothetical protein